MYTTIALPLLISLGALIGLIWAIISLWRALDSEEWDRVDCEIVESRVDIRRGRTTSYVPIITYKYAVNGLHYEGKKIKYGGMWSFKSTADDYCKKYSSGRIVKVNVDPNDPNKCVLERGASSYNYFIICFCTGCEAIGLIMLLRYFHVL